MINNLFIWLAGNCILYNMNWHTKSRTQNYQTALEDRNNFNIL